MAVAGDITESIGAASSGKREGVRVDPPLQRDLLFAAGTSRRDDGDVVKGECPLGTLAAADVKHALLPCDG